MARSVLTAEMISRARLAADAQNDTHITDVWLYLQATALVARLWDILTMNGLGSEGIKTVFFDTVTGQQEYAIAGAIYGTTATGSHTSTMTDFYKVKTLYCNDGNGLYRPVGRVTPQEEYAQRAPDAAKLMKLCYLPCAPVWSTGSESFDGINGYEEWIVQGLAHAIRVKKADDPGQHKSIQREVEDQIRTAANRNQDEPPRVIRRRASGQWAARTLPYSGGVGGWDIRGANFELFSPAYGLYL